MGTELCQYPTVAWRIQLHSLCDPYGDGCPTERSYGDGPFLGRKPKLDVSHLPPIRLKCAGLWGSRNRWVPHHASLAKPHRPIWDRHFKGMDYTVIGTARHSETQEELVVFQQEYGERSLWVRPVRMFSEFVNVEGKSIPRFQCLTTSASGQS
jgi:hypothetical protein